MNRESSQVSGGVRTDGKPLDKGGAYRILPCETCGSSYKEHPLLQCCGKPLRLEPLKLTRPPRPRGQHE